LIALHGLTHDVNQVVLLGALRRGLGTLLWACLLLGNGQAGLLCQIVDGLNEAGARVVHEKANGVAVFSAAEAVIKLFGGADGERGGLFSVKGAQAHVVRAALFELHVLTHHVHHVGTRYKVLNKGLGDGHGYIVREARAPEPSGWLLTPFFAVGLARCQADGTV